MCTVLNEPRVCVTPCVHVFMRSACACLGRCCGQGCEEGGKRFVATLVCVILTVGTLAAAGFYLWDHYSPRFPSV